MPRLSIPEGAAIVLILLCAVLVGSAQPTGYVRPTAIVRDGMLRIDVDEPSPLYGALRELQRQYGCTATYEDPRLEHADDLVESVVAKTGYRHVWPRGGALTFSHPFVVAGDADEFAGAVRALVRAYGNQGFPGRFRVEREGTMLHVVPAEVRNRAGDWVAVTPIMDAPTIFAVRDWADVKGIEAVVAGVRVATGASIQLRQWPLNLLMRHRARVGADNEPARIVLGRLLVTPYTAMSWSALYDFTRREYVFHIHSVHASNPRDPTRPSCWPRLGEPGL